MNAKTLEAIKRHGESLLAAFPNSTEKDPVALCKKLRRVETSLNKPLTDYCNGVNITSEELDEVCEKCLQRVRIILGLISEAPESKGVLSLALFVNRDPRGYALKLDDELTRQYNLKMQQTGQAQYLYRDMGGYGIIAPDLNQ